MNELEKSVQAIKKNNFTESSEKTYERKTHELTKHLMKMKFARVF